MLKFTKKRSIALGLVACLAIAGAAFAYFTSSGNGSGSGSVGTASTWGVTTDAAVGGALLPGSGSQSIAYHVNNASDGHQKLNTVTIKVATSTGGEWTSGNCSAADFSLDGAAGGASVTDSPAVDLAGHATQDGTVTLTMLNRDANQNDCQGVTVPLYVSAA